MTVVVAFVGNDGAVMASDSEGTEADQTRREVEKIWTYDGRMVFGYSGNSVIAQPLKLALEKGAGRLGADPDRWDVRSALCGAANPVLQTAYDNFAPRLPPGNVPPPLAGTLIVIGRDGDGFWLLEVDQHNGGSWYTDPGFHAVGTGSAAAQMANGLLAHYEPIGRSVAHLRLIAFRAVAACIGVLGGRYGVGGQVQMWQATGDDDFVALSDADLDQVAHGVEQWTTIEGESLDRVLLEEPAPEGPEMPEALPEEQAETSATGAVRPNPAEPPT